MMPRLLSLAIFVCLATAITARVRPKKPICGWAPVARDKYEKLDPFYSATQFKVLNGDVPPDHVFPFTAAIAQKSFNVTYCTASIIGSRYLLSAAHCFYLSDIRVEKEYIKTFDVSYGSVSVKNGTRNEIVDILFTPRSNYDQYHDIMILKLKNKINFDKDVQPVCLTKDIKLEAGKELIITGFGNHSIGPDTYKWMNEYVVDTIPVRRKSDCNFRREEGIVGHAFCAGGIEKGSMRGDSGGPMYALHKKYFYQVGVVSVGKTERKFIDGKLVRDDAAEYTKVGDYCKFIETATEGEVECRHLKS